MEDHKLMWNMAGRAGWVLGGISAAYMAIQFLLGKIPGTGAAVNILSGLLTFVLWMAKFGGSLYLLRLFMKRFAMACPEADNRDSFRFGVLAALLSALIYSAFYLAWVKFVTPDLFQQVVDNLSESMHAFLTTAQIEEMQDKIPDMPKYLFFGNLFYCWAFGTVASAIFARNIPPRNPFKTL